ERRPEKEAKPAAPEKRHPINGARPGRPKAGAGTGTGAGQTTFSNVSQWPRVLRKTATTSGPKAAPKHVKKAAKRSGAGTAKSALTGARVVAVKAVTEAKRDPATSGADAAMMIEAT